MPRVTKPQPAAPTGPRLVRQPTPNATPAAALSQEQIALRAYAIFEEQGRVHGRHLDHWLQAERELTGTLVAPAPTKRPAGSRARR